MKKYNYDNIIFILANFQGSKETIITYTYKKEENKNID